MATTQEHNEAHAAALAGKEGLNGGQATGFSTTDHAAKQRTGVWGPSGGNPLAHVATNDPELRLAAFGGEFQPGLYRAPKRNIANPAPLGLSAFALTTFILSLINMRAKNVTEPNLVVAAALIFTPGGFEIVQELGGASSHEFLYSFGFYLMGWFIFTFILVMCTLRSTVMFFSLFLTLDLAFLMLGIAYLDLDASGAPRIGCVKAGGVFGILSAFLAWYNAFAGIADSSNSFFVIPVIHFPWSDKGRERRGKVDNDAARAEQSV